MKTLATLFTLLGVMAMLTPESAFQTETFKAESIAANYGIYRNAVNNYVTGNATVAEGIAIPSSLLALPSGWKPMRAWVSRLDGGNLYVWGPVEGSEADEIRKLFMNSYAIGVKRSGHLVNTHGTGIALPSFIPENNIVSVITP